MTIIKDHTISQQDILTIYILEIPDKEIKIWIVRKLSEI